MPKVDREELAKQYGYAYHFFKGEPELWDLINRAVAADETGETWDAQRFQAELYKTKWWEKATAANIKWQQTKPADRERQVEKQYQAMKNLANGMGATVPKSTLKKWAKDSLVVGWSQAEIQNKFAKYIETVKDTSFFGGEAGKDAESLHAVALSYGQKITDSTVKNWVVNIARGEATVNDFKAKMAEQAQASYPRYTEQIRKGMTIQDIAEPYMQTMARTLELAPGNLDVFDKHIQKALTHRTADKTETGGSPEFSMFDFEKQLRQDKRWARTKDAQDRMGSLVAQVRQDWGL